MGALRPSAKRPLQGGFVAGRHIEDNLFQLDASAIAMGASNSRTAAGIFFDFCTAFPALAHRWIFLVLDAMLVPLHITGSIRKLYLACSARMMFNGNMVGNIQILCGIKQGCPMSGSIFALAIDPCIRFMMEQLGPSRAFSPPMLMT